MGKIVRTIVGVAFMAATVLGDTNSVSVSGVMDSRDYLLTVSSAHGTPVPFVGTNVYAWSASVTCSVASAVEQGTNWICTGWGGSGSVPTSGSTNTTGAISLTNLNSSITWNWNVSYTLNVTGGDGSGSYTNGQNVPIAAILPAGKTFDRWTGATQYVADVRSSTTTVTMPGKDINLAAMYVALGNLTIQTNGIGTVTREPAGDPEVGQIYTLTATPGSGSVFSNWTGDFASTNKVLIFTMTTNKTVIANFIFLGYYSLTITDGSGTGSYTNGAQVQIVADTPRAGQVFDKWTGATEYVASVTSSPTTVRMPVSNITITATYKDVFYTLTVNSGLGSASCTNQQRVEIKANTPLVGQTFNRWTGATQHVSSVTSSPAVVTMPATNITVTATYKTAYYALTVIGGTGSGPCTNGQKVTIAAMVPVGMKFSCWNDGNTNVSRVIIMAAADAVYTASFKDIQNPVLTLSTPLTGARLTNAAVTVTGKATDNSGAVNVLIQLNSGSWATNNALLRTTNWTANLTLLPGSNSVKVCARDATDNSSATNTLNLTYAVMGTLTIQTNGVGTVTRAPTGAPEVNKTYTLTAAAGTGSVFSNWTGAVSNPTNKMTTFVMTSNMTIRANFTDIGKPTVAITAPTALQKVYGTNSDFTVRGTATDNLALSNVMVKVNSGSFVPASTTTNGLKSWMLPVVLSTSLGGTNTIAAYSIDTTGNCSVTVTTKCVYVETGTLNITTNGPGKVTVTPAGPLLLNKTYTLTAAANAGAVFSNWVGKVVGNPTGKVVKVTLNATNKTVAVTANFTDTAKPTVTITLPTANLRITNTNPVYTVKGTATDNASVATVKVQLNSGAWTNAVTTNAWKNWSVPVALIGGTNTILAYSVDGANNCSATSSVKCVYVETITLGDYYVLPLGAEWLYDGKDWDGDPSNLSNRVASVNYVITNFTGGVAARSYTTNTVCLSADADGDTWDEYMAGGGRFGFFGDDDLPDESIRVDGGLIFPDQMLIGSSAAKTVNTYDKGIFKGTLSGKLQLIEKTSFTVPAGTFPDVLHVRITFGTQVFDEWWAKSVGMIKKKGVSGAGAARDYELTRYSIPSASSITASADPMGTPSGRQDVVPASTSLAAITVDGSSKDWTSIPRSSFSYASVTQEVAVALGGNNIALLLSGCPFNTSDTVLVYFKLRLTYGVEGNRHTVDLWTSGSVLYGMVDGQVITGLEAVLLNGVLEVKIPVEQAPSQVTIEEVGCGMDVGGGMMADIFKITPPLVSR